MVKRVVVFLFLGLLANYSFSQIVNLDSIKQQLSFADNDTAKMILYGKIALAYEELNPDSSYGYGQRELLLAQKLKLKEDEARTLGRLGYAYINLGNYPRSLQTLLKALEIANDS